MSLSDLPPLYLRNVRFDSGERRAYLVDANGIPDWYSTLYVTCEVRNVGLSVATEEGVLNAINVLYAFAKRESIDLVACFRASKLLDNVQCEALRNFAQRNFGPKAKKQATAVALGKGKRGFTAAIPKVARPTQYTRLTYIAEFLMWLAIEVLRHCDNKQKSEIKSMRDEILERRPNPGRAGDDIDDKTISHDDNALLNELIMPGAPRNPFSDKVQLRNQLIVELLRGTGMRRGEVLNLWVRDINLIKRHINVIRRHDSKDDPRVKQPLVKTRNRSIPIGPSLADLINRYLADRKLIPGATKQPTLLVTYKSGETQGQPMTLSAVNQVFATIQRAEPQLSNLTPHPLRHYFSNELARKQQETPRGVNDRENDRRVRNYLAGRSPESPVDAIYTQRETKRQAQAVSLKTQEEMLAQHRPKVSPGAMPKGKE